MCREVALCIGVWPARTPFDAGVEGLKQEEKRYAAAQEEKE